VTLEVLDHVYAPLFRQGTITILTFSHVAVQLLVDRHEYLAIDHDFYLLSCLLLLFNGNSTVV
jgi:hypothetical protein